SRWFHEPWLCPPPIPASSGPRHPFLRADQNLSAFSAGRLKCCSRLSRLSQEMAVRDRHSSRVWPGCSLSGCGPKPVRFFCRSSELLLASLVAISRNGCARPASQPPLAGGVASWLLTNTRPLSPEARPSRRPLPLLSRGSHRRSLCPGQAVRIRIRRSERSGPRVRLLHANSTPFSAAPAQGRTECLDPAAGATRRGFDIPHRPARPNHFAPQSP